MECGMVTMLFNMNPFKYNNALTTLKTTTFFSLFHIKIVDIGKRN